jgi:uncharacterized membrane protein
MRGTKKVTDRQVELLIGMLLRVGVIAAACVVFAGGIVYLYNRGGNVPHYESFHGEPDVLKNIPGIVMAAVSLDSPGLIQAGLLLLIAIPIMRVVVSFFAFALERDWMYCVFTALVLAILLFSLLGGRV